MIYIPDIIFVILCNSFCNYPCSVEVINPTYLFPAVLPPLHLPGHSPDHARLSIYSMSYLFTPTEALHFNLFFFFNPFMPTFICSKSPFHVCGLYLRL